MDLCLYTTLGCHLCDLAQDVLAQSGVNRVEHIDIADDQQLMHLYGVRIPVLKDLSSGKELDWPFDEQACRAWLKTL